LAIAGAVIATVTGGLGLLFTLQPGLKPCIGDESVVFTGAPVFPGGFREHLIRTGVSREEAASEPDVQGAEVRFSYRTSSLKGDHLRITWSLIPIERDGTFGRVIAGQDRAVAMEVEPATCSEGGGNDLFVTTPGDRKRYRVVLELYRGSDFTNRLAFTITEPFRG